jgi:hypothetical protein
VTALLPSYSIYEWREVGGLRFLGDADGIDNAEAMVETLLLEGEAAKLEIVLDGRTVEVGVAATAKTVRWTTFGRRRDLR